MNRKKIKSRILLLTAALLSMSMVLSVSPAQARCQDTAVWNTMVQPTRWNRMPLYPECLVPGGQIILLKQPDPLEQNPREIPIFMMPDGGGEGKMSCRCSQEEWLTASLSEDSVSVMQGGAKVVYLTLAPNEKVWTTVHEDIPAEIEVSWGDMLSGTFRVTLPAVTEEMLNPEEKPEPEPPTDPEKPTSPEESTEQTDPEEPDPSEETEPKEPDPSEETEPKEPDPSEEINPKEPNPTEQTTPEETETSVPDETGEAPEQPEKSGREIPSPAPARKPRTAPRPVQEEQQEEPVEKPQVPEAALLRTIPVLPDEAEIPIKISAPEGTDRLLLGLSDAGGTMHSFPACLRYSLDGGKQYYFLYDEDMITLPSQTETVLLDVSALDLSTTENLTVLAEAYGAGQLLNQEIAQISCLHASAIPETLQILSESEQTLVISLPVFWKYCDAELSLFRMQFEQSGRNISLKAVPEGKDFLKAVRNTEGEGHSLSVIPGEKIPEAGSYQVHIRWSFAGTDFAESRIPFFIIYTDLPDEAVSEQEVPVCE